MDPAPRRPLLIMEPEEPAPRAAEPTEQHATAPLPADPRTSFLEPSVHGDETLLTQVLVQPGGTQTSAPAVFASAAEPAHLTTQPDNPARLALRRGELKPGDTLGDCRIISLIGEGGMGEVYLAQDTRLERRVAVKLLKRYLADDEIERRFRHERKVLAALSHPGIAQLYGAALTPEGRSYFVMEYVEGERLDYYCNRNRLDLSARLELFRKVGAAVAYAHQHLVVHRDLKPPNIRVTPEGEPKLLDFGIAKLLDASADNTDSAEHTLTVTGSMTPAYASPEQLRGEGITTATDIYSLGVILYELLVGQRPYAVQRGLPEEVAQAICSEPIRRPSVAATQTARKPAAAAVPATPVTFQGIPADKLPRLLSGDLDNIVIMAMRKEPERRYASVSLFSEDIRRHLEGRPVVARPDTWGYRTSKFIARNKVGVAAAVLLFLSLLGGLAATARETRRANRRFEDVRRLAKSMIFEVEPQIASLSGSTPARALLIQRAQEYLDNLAREAGNNRDLLRELAYAYEHVGDVQGNPVYANLGDLKAAKASYDKSGRIYESLLREDPRDARTRHELARHYEEHGTLLAWNNQVGAAMENYRKALALRKPLLAEEPANIDYGRGYASLLMSIGDLEEWNNREKEALPRYREALPYLEAAARANPGDPERQIAVARCLMHMGTLVAALKDFLASAEFYGRAKAILDPLIAANPDNGSARLVRWVVMYDECDQLKNQDRLDETIAACPAMIAAGERIVARDPKNTATRHNLANGYNIFGQTLLEAGRYPEAIEQLTRSIEIDSALARQTPENGEFAHSCGNNYWSRGRAHFRLNEFDAAQADFDQSRRLLEEAAAKDPDNLVPSRLLVKVYISQGEVTGKKGDVPGARRWFEKAFEHLSALNAKKFTQRDDEDDYATLKQYFAILPTPAP